MDAGDTLRLILDSYRLKNTPRIGWLLRGVADAESVAAHSFGVAFISLVLSELVDLALDRAKLLAMALLHDLPEGVIGDLPAPAARHFPPGAKEEAEARALHALLGAFPAAERWRAWCHEFREGTSDEGRLVRDADRLDMLVQAHVYEQSTGSRCLDEFWSNSESLPFGFPAAQDLYEELRSARRRPAWPWFATSRP